MTFFMGSEGMNKDLSQLTNAFALSTSEMTSKGNAN